MIFENGMTYNHNTKIKSTSHEMLSVEFNSCDVVYHKQEIEDKANAEGEERKI